jgi:acetyl-CoA carboxylase biotin carboxyl carrier protein
MEFEDIERILELVRQHDLAEFEVESGGMKLRIRKASAAFPMPHAMPPVAAPAPHVQSHAPAPVPSEPDASLSEEESVELAVVKSPIVGTFYRSPEPGASSFVEIGQHVKKDQVLCIIEAMKLMNEITSEYDGEIVNAYVENGKPVQYGERLFAIRTA